jgi:hypothetical protein
MLGKLALLSGSLLLAGVIAALPAAAQQSSTQGDSLADAARKAREHQKEEPKAKKVYTDDDLSHPAAPAENTAPNAAAATTASDSSVQAKPSEANAKSETPTDANSEKEWRKRFREQRAAIAQAEKELDVLQRGLDKDQLQYYPDPQKALNEQFSRKGIQEKSDKIEAKKKQIAQLKQQLSDMEDELRKSGNDPGWARE